MLLRIASSQGNILSPGTENGSQDKKVLEVNLLFVREPSWRRVGASLVLGKMLLHPWLHTLTV